jgi:hypothetical protein
MNQKINDIIREAYPELDDTIINDGWSFEEYVNDKIEDLKGYETR